MPSNAKWLNLDLLIDSFSSGAAPAAISAGRKDVTEEDGVASHRRVFCSNITVSIALHDTSVMRITSLRSLTCQSDRRIYVFNSPGGDRQLGTFIQLLLPLLLMLSFGTYSVQCIGRQLPRMVDCSVGVLNWCLSPSVFSAFSCRVAFGLYGRRHGLRTAHHYRAKPQVQATG